MPQTTTTRSRTANTPEPKDEAGKKPVERFRDGPVHVSIWERSGPKGLFRTASFQLRYREGDEWRTSQSYGLSDLAHIERAAHRARDNIERWQATTMTKPQAQPGS